MIECCIQLFSFFFLRSLTVKAVSALSQMCYLQHKILSYDHIIHSWRSAPLLGLLSLHDRGDSALWRGGILPASSSSPGRHEKSHLFQTPSCPSCQQTLKTSVVLTGPATGRNEKVKPWLWFQTGGRGRLRLSVKLLELRAKEPAVLMDCAIVRLQINSYFLSSEIGSAESNWREERMQSKVSEGSDSSFLPITCRHCLTQLVVTVKCASHSFFYNMEQRMGLTGPIMLFYSQFNQIQFNNSQMHFDLLKSFRKKVFGSGSPTMPHLSYG